MARNFDFGTPFNTGFALPTTQQFFETPPPPKKKENAKRDPNCSTYVYNYNIKVTPNALEHLDLKNEKEKAEMKPLSLSDSNETSASVTNENNNSYSTNNSDPPLFSGSVQLNANSFGGLNLFGATEKKPESQSTSPASFPLKLSFDLPAPKKKDITKEILYPTTGIARPVNFNFPTNATANATSPSTVSTLTATPPAETARALASFQFPTLGVLKERYTDLEKQAAMPEGKRRVKPSSTPSADDGALKLFYDANEVIPESVVSLPEYCNEKSIESMVEASIKGEGPALDFQNVEMKKLPEKLFQHTSLHMLRLPRTLEVLPADLCERLPSLTHLDLMSCSNFAFQAAQDVIRNYTSLQSLNMMVEVPDVAKLVFDHILPVSLNNTNDANESTVDDEATGTQVVRPQDQLDSDAVPTAEGTTQDGALAVPEKTGTRLTLCQSDFHAFLFGNRHATKQRLSFENFDLAKDSLSSAEKIVFLDLSSWQGPALPPQLGKMTNLQELYMICNKFRLFRPEAEKQDEFNHQSQDYDFLLKMKKLRVLNLNFAKGYTIARAASSLKSVIDEPMLELPDRPGALNFERHLVAMTNLTRLTLFGHALKSVPESITQLQSLWELSIGENSIRQVSPAICRLPLLVMLNLSGNELHDIPSEISQLTALKFLNLNDNQLTRLPDSVGFMTSLSDIFLTGNRLRSMPLSFVNFDRPHLTMHLRWNDNEFADPLLIDFSKLDGNSGLFNYINYFKFVTQVVLLMDDVLSRDLSGTVAIILMALYRREQFPVTYQYM